MNDKKFGSWEEAVNWLVTQPDQQDLVKACYYDRPALQTAERFWNSDEWQSIRKLLPVTKGKVLDVGAGNGISSFSLAKDGWKTTALEPDTSKIVGSNAIKALAEEAGLTINVVEEFGEKLPFLDDSFDAIHARQVLHHADDLNKFCAELYRVLKPSGTLIATREHVISNNSQLDEFLKNHALHNLYGGEHAFTLKVYKSALNWAGFSLDNILGPFDSVINYAPFTRETLREELLARLSKIPAGKLLAGWLLGDLFYDSTLKLLSKIDNRPGRLYTFVAKKGVIT